MSFCISSKLIVPSPPYASLLTTREFFSRRYLQRWDEGHRAFS